jgi:nifR3 family TIM-barrel protein
MPSLSYTNRVIMAPMSGVNSPSFCEMLMRNGCDFIYTGLLTSHGVAAGGRKTFDLIRNLPDSSETFTLVAQIFGSQPDYMARAAAVLEATGKFAGIDINMGCPAPKVTKNAGGAALMRNPAQAADIVRAAVAATRLPVSVKIRSGWDANSLNYLEIARACEAEGAAAIALHPRTRSQQYSGSADWDHIARLKETVSVPVIGSGDIIAPEDAARMIARTGCDSVMIGRACCGDVWLIGRARAFLETGATPPPPTALDRIRAAMDQLELHVRYEGGERGVREMRRYTAWHIKGMPEAAMIRHAVNRAQTEIEMRDILLVYEGCIRREHGYSQRF